MSTTTQATAEVQALAEALAHAQKALELSKAMVKEASTATQGYSAALHAAALVQEQEAAQAAKAAQQALLDYSDAAKGATTDTQDLSRLFAKAFGEEVPEKIGDTKKAFAAFGDASLSATDRAKGLFAGVGLGASALRAGVVGLTGYVDRVIALGQASVEAATRMQALQERSRAVSGSMDAVREATGGAGSETDAFAVRTALLNANLDVNAQAIAQTLEFTRQHRRAGEENSEALQRVIAAVQGNAAAQAELGIRIRAGSTAMEAQTQALQQMDAANRAAGPSAQTAQERQEQLARGFDRVKDAGLSVAGFLTQATSIYTGLSDAANVLASAQGALSAAWNYDAEASARAGERAAAAGNAEVARRRELQRVEQGQIQAREEGLRGIRQEIALRAAQTGVESGFLTVRDQISATEAVYTQRVAQQAALSRRHGESEQEFLQRQLDGLGQVSAARGQLLQLEQQQEQQRRARDDLGVQATTLRNLGLQISSQVRGLSVQAQYNGLVREARDLRRSELETQTEFEQRAAATVQALEASRQRVIQQAQQALAAREARFGLGRTADESIRAGVPGFQLLRGVVRRSEGDEYARTEAEAFRTRRRPGEDQASFDNTRNTAQRRLLELRARNVEAEIRMEESRRRFLEANGEDGSQVTGRTEAIGSNRDAFRGMRDGIGTQLAMRMREQQSLNSLRLSGGASEGNLRKLMVNLEEQSTTLLSQGGEENMRRATAIQAEAQAVANAINGYRELTQAMRESNDGARQFAIAFSGSREAAERTEFTMADFARTSRGAFDVATGAAQQHFQALIEGKETAGQAMAGFGQDLLKGLANYFVGQGIAHGAAALGAAAIGNFPGMGLELAASAGFFAAAGIAGAVGAAVAPSPPSGAAAAAVSGGAPARGSDVSSRGDGGTTIINNNYNGLLTLPEAGRMMVRSLDAADRQGHRPQNSRS